MRRLDGKWALITGSSRGIGQQIAVGLAERGCNLVLHARALDNLKKTESLVSVYNVKVEKVAAELSKEEEIDNMVEYIKSKVDVIDILYNNAAVMSNYMPVFDIPLAHYKEIFNINVWPVVKLCSAFAPAMKKQKWGRIVNTTSGIADEPSLAPYSISKATIDKYTKDIAFELKDFNVLVNTIDPGWLKTDLGGDNAWFEVETVLPGAIVPALLDDYSTSGELIRAQDYKMLEK